jgi:hypothetical protein
MKFTRYKSMLIFFVLTCIYSYAGTIKGVITDAGTGEPLIGANVLLIGTRLGAASDLKGFYIIKDVSPGKYILKASYLAYKDHIDKVIIKDQDDTIYVDIKLRSYMVDLDSVSSRENEAYHKMLEEMNKIKPVLQVYIDSLVFSDNDFVAYLSMSNNCSDSFYVFKNYYCFQVIRSIIKNSNGDIIKREYALFDCLGEKTCPDSTDLILLRPRERIKYEPVKLAFYRIPKGIYSIRVKYEFKKPIRINEFYCRNIKYLIKGLRGTYISSNAITFVKR